MNVKKIIRAGIRFITDSDYRFLILAEMGKYDSIPDDIYLKRKYKATIGRELNLDNPQSFNEKIQWLKLYNRKPEYVEMVDKYLVRDYISKKIGNQYLIPILGVWNTPDEIPLDELPSQFVLKCNHNSGLGMCICKDKEKLNIKKAQRRLQKGLAQDYYLTGREWPYKDVPRKIIAEQYMKEENKEELTDYKFMCFNGKVKCLFTCTDRFSEDGLKVTFYDKDWNVLPFERHYPALKTPGKKPESLKEMIELAEILSEGIPFVRIDFYEIGHRPYFGEITLFPGSGFEEFTPEEWDYTLGSWIQLPSK